MYLERSLVQLNSDFPFPSPRPLLIYSCAQLALRSFTQAADARHARLK